MKLYIIGGGAAGIMAGIFAAKNNAEVTIIEKNEKLGKKLYITGKGRCNLSNLTTYEEYQTNIISNPKFLCGALRLMPPENTVKLFNGYGLATKVERGNRIFPVSDKSSDVINTLKNALTENNVKIIYNEEVVGFESENNRITSIITNKNKYTPDKVLLATGGISYPLTGSDGQGFNFAKKLGHTIVPLRPALINIKLSNVYDTLRNKLPLSDLPKLQGLSLKNVEAKIIDNNNKILFKEFGEMLFTADGVSGPIILTLSSKINRLQLSDIKISIDLKPALDYNTLDNRFLREFQEKSNKFFKNSLNDVLPSSLIPFIIRLSSINENTAMNSVTKEQRAGLVNLLKGIRFDISALGDVKEAIVTAGGISTKEINPKTMQSKIIENLYFAGEIIDIDALTGGFNLQIAFATGCAAGTYINT